MNTIFIGIAGGTGSGKTTLTEHLKQHFGDDISVEQLKELKAGKARLLLRRPPAHE